MLDLNLIRSNPEYVKEALKKREYDVDFSELLEWDARRRALLVENESLKAERNRMSKEIPALKKQGKDASELLAKLKEMADQVKAMDEEQSALEDKIYRFVVALPNLPAEDVVAGGKENNQVVKVYGEKPVFDWEPKNHVDLCVDLGLIDYERGVKMGGNGYWLYTGIGAQLEWALLNYFITEHLGDGYGWEVPFCHGKRIALPVIVFGNGTGFHVFSSARVTGGEVYTAPDGKRFAIAGHDSPNKGKVVELTAGGEVRPVDFSITKNVCATFIAMFVVILVVLALSSYYKRGGKGAPRGFRGAVESLVFFIYDDMIKPTLGKEARRFSPYLLTVFMFIFAANLLGLIVIFPGGANLTGNIGVTLVLALITFFATNFFAKRHYWKEIFWPDVPIWLKCPLPIMQIIEVFGIFTKPAALTIRLFANMMGGHMIVITLTVLIFIFAAFGAAAAGSSIVISILFSTFMLALDVLVSFIQAYVFTMLSTIFISLAVHNPEHHESLDQEVEEAMEKSENPQTAGM